MRWYSPLVIGEHSAIIQKKISYQVAWLGLDFDESANETGRKRISSSNSKVSAWIVPTDENLMIAQHILRTVT